MCTTTKHEISQMKLTSVFFVTSALCSTNKLKIASSPNCAVIIRAVHPNCINITILLYCNIYFMSVNLITMDKTTCTIISESLRNKFLVNSESWLLRRAIFSVKATQCCVHINMYTRLYRLHMQQCTCETQYHMHSCSKGHVSNKHSTCMLQSRCHPLTGWQRAVPTLKDI